VGVRVSLPLRNRTARANYGRALAEGRRVENRRARQEQVIEATDSARAYSAVPIDVPSAATGRTIADGLVEPDTALEHVELRHALRPVLAGLDERERRALLLRFVENKTQSEIAQLLGVSQVHVSRLLAKTLAALRDRLPDMHHG